MNIEAHPDLIPARYCLDLEERQTLKNAADILENINNEGFDIDDDSFDPGLEGTAGVLRHLLERDDELIIPNKTGYKIL